MYIQTDDNGNITQVIFIGDKPEINGYEIDTDTVSNDILTNIEDYQYINGEFIKKENADQERLERLRNIKISNMSKLCQNTIYAGIDYNGEHYTLSDHDQFEINDIKYTAVQYPDLPISYHADDGRCRTFTYEEFMGLAALAKEWIFFNRTYFNTVKAQIKEMESVDDIVNLNYGDILEESFENDLITRLSMYGFNSRPSSFSVVEDTFDYNNVLVDVDIDYMNEQISLNEVITEYQKQETVPTNSTDEEEEIIDDEEGIIEEDTEVSE